MYTSDRRLMSLCTWIALELHFSSIVCVCPFVCVCSCMHVCVWVFGTCLCLCARVLVCAYVHVCVHVCMYERVFV